MGRTALATCAIALSGMSVVCPVSGQNPPRGSDPRQVLQAAVLSGSVGSAVGLIARDGRIVFLEAVGEAGPGAPMKPDAIVRLASITKPVTATAIMILVEEGKLNLSDPVDRFLPGFGRRVLSGKPGGDSVVAAIRPVTIHDLLTHQSGISTDDSAFDPLWDQARTALDFSRMLGAIPLRFQPGSQFHYGYMGSSYEVLAGIVECLTGGSFKDFVTSRILTPLGMNDTYFHVPEAKRPRLAAQYRQQGPSQLIRFRELGQEEAPTDFFSGGGSLRSTVTDYFRFAQVLLNGGELEGVRLLRRETVRQMLSNQVGESYPAAGFGWGFGVQVRTVPGSGPEQEGNFGWNGGTGTQFLVDPSRQLVIVIFAPSTPRSSGVNQLRRDFIAAAYQLDSR